MTHLKNKYSIEYAILGFEKGEENQTPHIQGYIHFTNAQTFDNVRKNFENEDGTYGFVDIAYGDDKDNLKYCSKQGNYIEYKTPKEETDYTLESIIDDITNGMQYIDICKKHHKYVLYHYRDFKQLYHDMKHFSPPNENIESTIEYNKPI